MSMGTRRQRQRQEPLWITHTELARAPGHPFYKRLNQLLDEGKFDEFAEKECAKFYAENNGRPSLTPGIYFRLLLVGYFEGIDSERGIDAFKIAHQRSEEHTSELQSRGHLVCRLLLEKKKKNKQTMYTTLNTQK